MNRELDDKQLEEAVAENHRQLFALNAVACPGELVDDDGVIYSFAAPNEANIGFARLDDSNAAKSLNAALDFFRKHEATNIGYWSLDPPQPSTLAAYLLARGFETGWRPCWMAINTDETPLAGHRNDDISVSENDISTMQKTASPTMIITPDNHTPIHEIPNLPYNAESGTLSRNLLQQYPERVQRFIGTIGDRIVAQCCLFFSESDLAIAGMYNVGVIPSMRKRGFGKMIVSAAVNFAKARGFRYVMLNANEQGRPVYERVGFRVVSYGLTWWLTGRKYIDQPDSMVTVQLAQAAGTGNVHVLNTLHVPMDFDFDKPLINGLTLVQLAIECKQPAAVEWLVAKGARCTVLNAWDLGWHEHALQQLSDNPNEIKRNYFAWKGNLLHVAAQRGDLALARFALDHGVDINHKDIEHNATPLGWAQYFRRWEIGKIISMHKA